MASPGFAIPISGALNNLNNVSDSINLNALGLPPALALEEQAINRKQQLANLLIQRSLQPIQGQQAGRFYVPPHWSQGLAQLGTAAAGAGMTLYNDQSRRDLAGQSDSMLAGALDQYKQQTAPTTQQVEGPGAPVPTGLQPGQGYTPEELKQPTPLYGTKQDALNALYEARTPAFFQEGPRPTTQIEKSPQEKQSALVDLMASQHPQARAIGQLLMQQQAKEVENAQQERFHGDDVRLRELGITENAAGRLATMQNTLAMKEMQLAQDERNGIRNDNLRREIQAQTAELRKMEMASREAQTKLMADTKKEIASQKTQLSPTAQKELFEADEAIQAAKNVTMALDQALAMNDKAYDGFQAGNRAAIASNIPGVGKEGANATVELDNIITNQALGQLKATFGGMPTEGERKILLEVQGSVNQTAPQRKAIWERAKAAVQRRQEFNEKKTKALRDNSYFSENFMDNGPAAQSGPAKISSDADYDALPSGAVFIGPDGVTRKKP